MNFANEKQVLTALNTLQVFISKEVERDIDRYKLVYDSREYSLYIVADGKRIESSNFMLKNVLKSQARRFKKDLGVKDVKKLEVTKTKDDYKADLLVQDHNGRKRIINIKQFNDEKSR